MVCEEREEGRGVAESRRKCNGAGSWPDCNGPLLTTRKKRGKRKHHV
jgi:hypothetical protein